jgi:glyoxylase-like metal-dependent hydrolase (beta-lactamase superfamily II)
MRTGTASSEDPRSVILALERKRTMFVFEQLRTGGDRNFGYLVGDRKAGKAVLVDPSYDPGRLVDRARVQNLEITHILNTHGHSDHTNGNKKACRFFNRLYQP